MTKIFLVFVNIIIFSAIVLAQETVPAASSELAGISLPTGAARVREDNVPAEITQSLDKLVDAGGGKIRSGEREVLAWTNNFKRSNGPALIKKLTAGLQTSGWAYEEASNDGEFAVFTLTRTAPEKRALLGFYTYSDEAFVLAWTEVVVTAKEGGSSGAETATPEDSGRHQAGKRVVNIPKNTTYVNAMGNEMPALPKFPALAPKPGKVRGYVKDASGKPLAGAAIGVRSTLIGGAYSGAQGKTDANGYYEFIVPRGVAHYYNAGYAIEYGDGLAAIGLHPADGSIDSFASPEGAVENFVLLTYGVTSRANLSENPRLPATYYGGSVYMGYWVVSAGDASIYPNSIVEDSVVEITLTPDGPLFDGSTGSVIAVRKTAGFDSGFWINNIPLGRYKIQAKLTNGKPLELKLNRPVGTVFGMNPTQTTSAASLLFSPGSAQASMVVPGSGSWDAVSLTMEKP